MGISFLSMQKAKFNAHSEIPHWSFEKVHQDLLGQWEQLFQKIEIDPSTPLAKKRMFYTGLYHTMLMPVDRTGENPLWSDPEPYYDDFYAIWDTYRSSSPLITLIDPKREADIVRSLVNIYKRDGYMPDARSGNSNGRTQGGSNAEIVIADAFVKGLKGIDYELALEAMLKDATVPPGGNEEAEGRGGLIPYLELGYIPHGIDRAGNRTVEYSYCDYAIALVAKGLGKEDLYQRYLKQSENWKTCGVVIMSMKGRKALSCRATRKETGWTLFLSVIPLACSRSLNTHRSPSKDRGTLPGGACFSMRPAHGNTR